MKMNKQHFRISVTRDMSVHGFLVQPDHNIWNNKHTVFIFSHGWSVDGTESFRLFIDISNKLISLGYPCFLFDYRGSGYSDLAFEDMTFSTEVADLDAVIKFARKKFPRYRIVLWGVSFGCAVAAQVSSQRKDVSLLVLWSLSAELYRRYCEKLGTDIFEKGYIYTEKGFIVKAAFLESLKGWDTYKAIKESNIPCLLVHGDADTGASIDLARNAHRIAEKNTTLYEIKGGNHGFKSQPLLLKEAIDLTLNWLQPFLK